MELGRWIHFAILRDLTESLILPNSHIPASQQLVPHFLILALSLNPVNEDSEFI
jgi:hypothetical protein